MNDWTTIDAYGVLTEPTTVKIQRLLPGPADRVWAYLTESDKRRQWLAAGDMDLTVGAPFTLTWRNDELMDEPGQSPDGMGGEHSMDSRITELDPPNRISFAWSNSGDVTFELESRGDEVLLTIIHRRLPSRDMLVKVAAGWHAHVDVLEAKIASVAPRPFWSNWQDLRDEYERRIPA